MPIPRPEPQGARVIAHVDLDCFYVQVEQRKQPELRGLPAAVVQYNSWKGGGLVAVSYEARSFGVKRSMRGDDAKMVCPNIQLIRVPTARGKADLNSYRSAGSEVVSILATKGRCERASIDEVYLDLTDAAESMLLENPPELSEVIDEEAVKSHVLGLPCVGDNKENNVRDWLCQSDTDHQDRLLACAAIIVAQLRTKVLEETKFTCSAGIAHNKMLAKLASGMHKPAQQTVVPSSSVKDLLASLPVKKMKQLGGKLGNSLQTDLGVNTVGDLLNFSKEKLQERYGVNTGTWLWNVARGISGEEVEGRLLPKSHGCGKTFPGPQALRTAASVEHWLNQLCEELNERIQSDLEQNKRVAHTLTLHARVFKKNELETQKKFPSKSCPLRYGSLKLQEDAKKLFDSALREYLVTQNDRWGVTSLSLSASKILDKPPGTCSILKFFKDQKPSTSSNVSSDIQDGARLSTSATWSPMIVDPDGGDQRLSCEKSTFDVSTSERDNTLNYTGLLVDNSKDKGACSILRFFKDQKPSTSSSVSSDIQDGATLSTSGTWSQMIADQEGGDQRLACEESTFNIAASEQDNVLNNPGPWVDKPKDKGKCSILRFFKDQKPSTALNVSSDIQDGATLSPSGTWSQIVDKEEGVQRLACEHSTFVIAASERDNTLNNPGPVIDKPKDKRKHSILRFFQTSNSSCSSTEAESSTSFRHDASLSTGNKNKSTIPEVPNQNGCMPEGWSNEEGNQKDQTGERSATWSFNVEDIDPSVVDELPLEIQREIRGWLRPTKRASTAKHGTSIAHYFTSPKSQS